MDGIRVVSILGCNFGEVCLRVVVIFSLLFVYCTLPDRRGELAVLEMPAKSRDYFRMSCNF